jgi:hypothetical protein
MHNEQMTYCGNVGVMNNLKESTVSVNTIALVPNTEAFPNEKQCHSYRRENIVHGCIREDSQILWGCWIATGLASKQHSDTISLATCCTAERFTVVA